MVDRFPGRCLSSGLRLSSDENC
ncbi:hypothetical protein JMJ77_0000663, partial [Colletotrichum scovillei]